MTFTFLQMFRSIFCGCQ